MSPTRPPEPSSSIPSGIRPIANPSAAQIIPSRIHVLPPVVAERIAAGEVIERPASVVKELVENSLDAGATEIQVLLEDGGKSLIEVTDNGMGMNPLELGLCIQRHATSKLASLDDLEKISTLGFRGEALPSVAAVAELSLLSRPQTESGEAEPDAYELVLGSLGSMSEAPVPVPVTFGHFLNSPHGTRIQVRGLFSQVPARLKFLKSQGAEVSQVREWIERLALAHPRAGFRLISDGRSIVNLRPQEETARVRTLLSDGDDYPIVTATNDLGFQERSPGSFHLRVHWLQGMSSPNARRVVQVVNGRAVKDKLLQQALLSPFRQSLLPGQYPAVALFLDIDPAVIDVNVHPTKTELRFLDSRKIFHSIDTLIQGLIQKNGAPGYAPSSWQAREAGAPGQPASTPAWNFAPPRTERPESPPGGWMTPPHLQVQQPLPSWNSAAPATAIGVGETASSLSTDTHATSAQAATTGTPNGFPFLDPGQWVGIFFNTYLAYDQGQELVLIDQHAAHERIRYEILRRRLMDPAAARLTPQALLIPEAVRFSEEHRARVQDQLPWLESLGFEAELFGEDTLLFRAVPAEWGLGELRIRLRNLVERLTSVGQGSEEGQGGSASQGSVLLDEALFEALASEACHSAIRAGDRLMREEALQLVSDLARCENPWNCPHGRPTLVRVPRGRFEEWFQRRV